MRQDVPSQKDAEQALASGVRDRAGVSVSSLSLQGTKALRPHVTYEDPQEDRYNRILVC